mgnify:CR=1 FL=1
MCALFGWLDYKGIVSNKLLKKLRQHRTIAKRAKI